MFLPKNGRGSSGIATEVAVVLCVLSCAGFAETTGKKAATQVFDTPATVQLNKTKEVAQAPSSRAKSRVSEKITTGSLPADEPTTASLPPLFSTETSSALDLVNTPSLAFTDLGSTEILASPTLDFAAMEPEDLDTTLSEAEAEPLLVPEIPLPDAELESLTSGSAQAKRITLMSAVCRALSCNQALRVQRLAPEISHTSIESAESEFDTTLRSGIFESTRHSSTLSAESKNSDGKDRQAGESVSRTTNADIELSGKTPTGTQYSLGFSTSRSRTNSTLPFYSSDLNLGITQSLLKGAGCEVNCIRVWMAQNSFIDSLYALQQVLIDLVDDVQNAYWDLYLALETLQIRREAYRVAREQRERTEEFVRVGKAPPLETLAAEAEESSRISDIIIAAADVKRRELEFLRLLNPEGMPKCWESLIYPADQPVLPRESIVPAERLRIARYYRPDLRQAKLDLANNELEVVETENGLLPALDLVTEAGYTGKGDTFPESVKPILKRDYPNWRVGLQFSYALQNRAARAAYRRANFRRDQAVEAIRNYQQLIEVDVRTALINIERSTRLIDSTEVTLRLREEELAAEIEKFRVGRSTQLLVAQAQRDLTSAQLGEISAKITNIRDYLTLYRVEGSTLQRCGIQPVSVTEASGVPKD